MIDLHSHSTASDGTYTPAELMIHAHDVGISAIALTDHDTLAGLAEAEGKANELGIQFIKGIELEINYPRHGEFHLLGLNLGQPSEAFKARLLLQQQKREERNLLIFEKMVKALKLEASYEDVKKLGAGVVGRVHFAQFLINAGKVNSVKVAFDKYLAVNRPFYVAKEAIDLEEALSLIKESGGKSVIAHPLSLYLSWGKLPEALKKYRSLGVDGIEAYHSQCTAGESLRLENLAKELGFIVTAGSDYHGNLRKDRKLGYVLAGKQAIEDRFLQNLLN